MLLGKPIFAHLIKKFVEFYGTPTVYYRIHKGIQIVPIFSQMNPVHKHSPHVSLPLILILSTHLRRGLPSDIFPSGFPTTSLSFFWSV
jgi:hypothetical protein